MYSYKQVEYYGLYGQHACDKLYIKLAWFHFYRNDVGFHRVLDKAVSKLTPVQPNLIHIYDWLRWE
jgi:hypothetical protein